MTGAVLYLELRTQQALPESPLHPMAVVSKELMILQKLLRVS